MTERWCMRSRAWGGGRSEAGAATLGPQAEGVNSVVAWTIEPSALPAQFPLLSAAALSGGSYSQLAEQFRMQRNDNRIKSLLPPCGFPSSGCPGFEEGEHWLGNWGNQNSRQKAGVRGNQGSVCKEWAYLGPGLRHQATTGRAPRKS